MDENDVDEITMTESTAFLSFIDPGCSCEFTRSGRILVSHGLVFKP